jgi:hypothetical protein
MYLRRDSQTLREAYQGMEGDRPTDIPLIVRLFENPASPIALPGKIDLYAHDCVHLLLTRGYSLEDEAFVIGFIMGNDVEARWFHVLIYKFVSLTLYPQKYQFHLEHMPFFDAGFKVGKETTFKNINSFDFRSYHDKTLQEIRDIIKIQMFWRQQN